MTTDSTLGLTLRRTDQPYPAFEQSYLLEDVGNLQGPGRKVILAGAGSTEYNLWTSSLDGNGAAFTTLPFERLLLWVDPEETLDDEDLGVWIKPYSTAVAGGSSTALTDWHFATRKCPLALGPTVGTSISGGKVITKLGCFNANADDDIPILLVLE